MGREKKAKQQSIDDPYGLSKKLLKSSTASTTDSRGYTRTNAGFVVEEGFLDALYRPHTITALILFLVGVVYAPSQIQTNHVQAGLGAGCVAFIFYGAIQFRDGLLIRPHPLVWRIVHAVAILYLVFLVFLMFQPYEEIRGTIFPMLGAKLTNPDHARSYGRDCVMFRNGTMNSILENTLFDIFVVCHGIGFVANALLVRNWTMLWVLSIAFEVLEASLQHILPNFQECWWDHLLLDIFGFNLLGIAFGMWLVNKLATGLFDWGGQPFRKLPSRRKKIKRIVWQLFPRKFERYHWSILLDFRRLCVVFTVTIGHCIHTLNAFFLKHIFVVPTGNPINFVRITIMAANFYPAANEYYEYAITPKARRKHVRLGQNAWVITLSLILEVLLIAKNIPPEMLVLPSYHVTFCWVLSSVLFSCWLVYQYYILPKFIHPWLRGLPEARASYLTTWLDPISLGSFAFTTLPLIYILACDCYRTYVFAEDPAMLAPVGLGDW